MAQDLTNLYISESFQSLLQVSSSTSASVLTNFIADGTGSLISNLEVTSSYASNVVSASYAATASLLLGNVESASYASNAGTADSATSASYAVTASYALNVTPHESASYAASASNADHADFADVATSATSSISSSFATNASTAVNSTSASYAATASILLGSIQSSSYANNSSTSDLADLALTANTASYVLGTSVDGKVASATLADTASLVYGFNVSGAVTSSLTASIATSASHALQSDSSLTANSATTATSASHAVQADSALASDTSTSASHAVQADNALNSDTSTTASYALSVDAAGVTGSVTSADEAEKVTFEVQNDEAHTLPKGTPVHITSTTNGTSLVVAASASVSGKMPAHGILNQQLTAGSDGVATILGQITGVDTSAFSSGDTIFVGPFGGYVNVKPTGSTNLIQNLGVVKKVDAGNGTGEIFGSGRSNDVPNIATSNLWIGNEDGVAVAIASSSLKVDNAVTASFLPSDTRLSISDITASSATFTSASIGFLQSVTGSAKIIGDAFLILNNDTPTERYAGIKVIDSGSTNTTASLQFDGQTNDWFYEYEGDDPTDHGVVLFGPEYGTIGSPTYNSNNTIPKGDGGHHLNDSSIVDDGVNVTTALPISGSGGFIGDLTGNADTSTTASNVSYANVSSKPTLISSSAQVDLSLATGTAATATSASHALQADNSLTASYATYATASTSASHALQADNSLTASFATYATASTSASHAVQADASLTSVSASYAPTNVNDAHTFTNVNTFNSQVHGGVTALTITSNTASMDMQDGNFFTLTLQNATDTHLDATNVTAGQTITLTVTNNATAAGTLTFSPDFKFAEGTAPTVTATTSAKDILTFVTTDSTDVFGTSLLNFS